MRSRLFFCFLCILVHLTNAQTIEEGRQYLDSLLSAELLEPPYLDSIQPLPNGYQKVTATVGYECYGDICYGTFFGLITPKGDTIPPLLYDVVVLESGDVLISANKTLILDSEMNVKKYFQYVSSFEQGLAVAKDREGYGLINERGEEVLPLTYGYVCQPDKWGRIAIRDEDQWKVWTVDDFIPPLESKDEKDDFLGASWSPKVVETWDPEVRKIGLIQKNGTLVQEYKYDEVQYLFNENILARIEDGGGLLDWQGKELTEFNYGKIHETGYAVVIYSDSEEFFMSGYGLLGHDGEELTPMDFLEISTEPQSYNGELFWIVARSLEKWGLLSFMGKEVAPTIYRKIDFNHSDGPRGLLKSEWVPLLK